MNQTNWTGSKYVNSVIHFIEFLPQAQHEEHDFHHGQKSTKSSMCHYTLEDLVGLNANSKLYYFFDCGARIFHAARLI